VAWGPIPITTSEDLKIRAQLSIPMSRIKVGVLRDGRRLDRDVTLRAAAAHGAPELHPSSCALREAEGTAEGAGREAPEELEVAALPADRATRLPGGTGVAIAVVPSDSAAAEAGLHIGDVILQVGKAPVRTVRDVAVAVRARKGEVIPILVRRSGYDFWAALRRR